MDGTSSSAGGDSAHSDKQQDGKANGMLDEEDLFKMRALSAAKRGPSSLRTAGAASGCYLDVCVCVCVYVFTVYVYFCMWGGFAEGAHPLRSEEVCKELINIVKN